MGNFDEALRYQEKSIAIKQKLGDNYGLAGSYINVGNIYWAKKDFPKTEAYYAKGYPASR